MMFCCILVGGGRKNILRVFVVVVVVVVVVPCSCFLLAVDSAWTGPARGWQPDSLRRWRQ